MVGTNQSHLEVKQEGAAFLVVREGATWRDVFRLTPGQVTTIGRAATNRVVVRDDVCSRNHCEIFQSGFQWTLRDLGSRNGTVINGAPVAGDWELQDGELIQIGACFLQQKQQRLIEYLVAENQVLRGKLDKKRLCFTPLERLKLATKGRALGLRIGIVRNPERVLVS